LISPEKKQDDPADNKIRALLFSEYGKPYRSGGRKKQVCQSERWQQAVCLYLQGNTARRPKSEDLSGVKEVKVEAITVGKHHNMCCPPDMGHLSVIVFHFVSLR